MRDRNLNYLHLTYFCRGKRLFVSLTMIINLTIFFFLIVNCITSQVIEFLVQRFIKTSVSATLY